MFRCGIASPPPQLRRPEPAAVDGDGRIDVVYTWVNGSDPHWLRDMLRYRSAHELGRVGGAGPGAAAPSAVAADLGESMHRYRDHDELRFSLRSLQRYAPYVGRIFIVTNGQVRFGDVEDVRHLQPCPPHLGGRRRQVPRWLNVEHPRITVVPHRDIFATHDVLPTFSSPAIEANLHRIPGLSRRFLYFNDDVFLGATTHLDDFVTRARGVRIFRAWPVPPCAEGCESQWRGDGFCDFPCNVAACGWDLGDCANVTEADAGDAPSLAVPPLPYAMEVDERSCAWGCRLRMVGDGVCDRACLHAACGCACCASCVATARRSPGARARRAIALMLVTAGRSG